jgi:hypothetical protein
MMCIRKRSDGHIKVVEGTDTVEPYVVLCGVTEGGEVKPIRRQDHPFDMRRR